MKEIILIFGFLWFHVEGQEKVDTFITDIRDAKLVGENHELQLSIWEPVSPFEDYYILGQYVNRGERPPPNDTQLIIAKSINASLKQPIRFQGGWKFIKGISVWSMKCPKGYVSLSAIANSGNKKPDVTNYRCVHRQATKKARIWPDACLFCVRGQEHTLRNIYSPSGWMNIFYVLEYPTDSKYFMEPYTLKKVPTKYIDTVRERETTATAAMAATTSRIADDFPIDDGDDYANDDEITIKISKSQDLPRSAPSYTILIISGGFILLVISALTIMFFIRSNHSKNSDMSITGSTVISPYDSTPPPHGHPSSSDGNEFEYGNARNSRKRFLSSLSTKTESISMQNEPSELELKENVLYSNGAKFEMRDNILYHSVRIHPPEDNEYQTISVEPIYSIAGDATAKYSRASGVYSYAT